MKDDISLETIGCDLGDKISEVYRLCSDGGQERATVRTTLKGMTAFFTRPRGHVVIEVGPHSRWVNELLQQLGHLVTVANPRQVKLISGGTNKSDRRDCELLARLGRVDVELLAPIAHRSSEAQADLAVAKGRDLLVATRTRLVNHVRGVLKSLGIQLPKCDTEYFGRKTRELVPRRAQGGTRPYLRDARGPRTADTRTGSNGGTDCEAVPRRRSRLAGERRGRADRVGVDPDDRRQEPLQEEPDGGSVSWLATSQVPVRKRRSTTQDHQGGRPVRAPALGEQRELHFGPIRQGQRPPAVGNGTGEAWGQEREEAREGGGRQEARRAPTPAVGHRGGLRADRLSAAARRSADRSVTITPAATSVPATGTDLSGRKQGTSTGGRKTTNRPVRATAHVPVSFRARSPDDSARTVRNRTCTEPLSGLLDECEWKRGGAVFRRPVDATDNNNIDSGRPPHGRHMGPAADIFARVMGPPNRQGHGARVAGDRTLARQGHGATQSPGSWGHPIT